jgi:hypothetical protein
MTTRPRTVVECAAAVRVVVIDPSDAAETVTVRTAHLPTIVSANPRHGLQVAPAALEEILGSRRMFTQWLDGADWLITTPDGAGTAWWLRGLGPRRGRGVVLGWDHRADAVDDARISTEEVAYLIELDLADADSREKEETHAALA